MFDSDGSAADASAPFDAQLTIQQVSTILRVPAPTIRSWERRYGLASAKRSTGGHRRYIRIQVGELQRMRDLISQGHRPAEAADLAKAGHPASPGPLVEMFVRGAADLIPESIARALGLAHQTLGLDRTVDEVLMPAMREIGEGWHVGQLDVSQEHLATNAARAWLANLASAGRRRSLPPIVLSCGPQDHHTLGLEALGALLRQRRWDCRLLGARTPIDSLGQAVAKTNAAAVVLVCHTNSGRPAALQALRSIQLSRSHVFFAGGVFATRQARRGVPGDYLGTSLAQAAELVTHTLTS